jgi:hypothetical protein
MLTRGKRRDRDDSRGAGRRPRRGDVHRVEAHAERDANISASTRGHSRAGAKPFNAALAGDGIPFTSFAVEDVH